MAKIKHGAQYNGVKVMLEIEIKQWDQARVQANMGQLSRAISKVLLRPTSGSTVAQDIRRVVDEVVADVDEKVKNKT